jgi:hypothetical protein
MQPPSTPSLKSKKTGLVFVFAAASLIFLSGASYAAALWQPPRVAPEPLFLPVAVVDRVEPLSRPVLEMQAPKSNLVERLNGRYRLGRSLHAAA